ncbi:MAG: hypothetical protein HHAS10_11130 [Candidatus Altimarinota bacterium]
MFDHLLTDSSFFASYSHLGDGIPLKSSPPSGGESVLLLLVDRNNHLVHCGTRVPRRALDRTRGDHGAVGSLDHVGGLGARIRLGQLAHVVLEGLRAGLAVGEDDDTIVEAVADVGVTLAARSGTHHARDAQDLSFGQGRQFDRDGLRRILRGGQEEAGLLERAAEFHDARTEGGVGLIAIDSHGVLHPVAHDTITGTAAHEISEHHVLEADHISFLDELAFFVVADDVPLTIGELSFGAGLGAGGLFEAVVVAPREEARNRATGSRQDTFVRDINLAHATRTDCRDATTWKDGVGGGNGCTVHRNRGIVGIVPHRHRTDTAARTAVGLRVRVATVGLDRIAQIGHARGVASRSRDLTQRTEDVGVDEVHRLEGREDLVAIARLVEELCCELGIALGHRISDGTSCGSSIRIRISGRRCATRRLVTPATGAGLRCSRCVCQAITEKRGDDSCCNDRTSHDGIHFPVADCMRPGFLVERTGVHPFAFRGWVPPVPIIPITQIMSKMLKDDSNCDWRGASTEQSQTFSTVPTKGADEL